MTTCLPCPHVVQRSKLFCEVEGSAKVVNTVVNLLLHSLDRLIRDSKVSCSFAELTTPRNAHCTATAQSQIHCTSNYRSSDSECQRKPGQNFLITHHLLHQRSCRQFPRFWPFQISAACFRHSEEPFHECTLARMGGQRQQHHLLSIQRLLRV